ncbi:MAG: ABC transporter substrate-binding protein, partial [Burkholderiales bacterium]
MNFKKKAVLALIGSALAATSFVASAVTLRIGNQGDAQSLDPHSLNESLQLTVVGNVYEPLVTRGRDYKLAPSLATDWKQTSPTVWRFNLRKGVEFHDGTPFTADDVIFSVARAAGDGSDVKAKVNDIKEVRKVNDTTIDIETKGPFPILPDVLSDLAIMSKKWCEENKAEKPVDRRKGVE